MDSNWVVMALASVEMGKMGPVLTGSAACGDGDDPGDLPGDELTSGKNSSGDSVAIDSDSDAKAAVPAASACLCLRDRFAKYPLDRREDCDGSDSST